MAVVCHRMTMHSTHLAPGHQRTAMTVLDHVQQKLQHFA